MPTRTTTTTVSELPAERRWLGRDWGKVAIAAILAISLLRPGVQSADPLAQQAPAATALAAPTVASVPPAATVGAETLPGVLAPAILSTREAPQAGPYTVQGTAAPGSTVRVTLNGAEVGTAEVAADGSWSVPLDLPVGAVEIVAEALDAAGAAVAASDPYRVTVPGAAAAPAAPGGPLVISAPVEGAELPVGPLTVGGTGSPGTALELLNSDQVVAETTVGDDGTWEVEVDLPEGTAAVSVRERGSADIAGRPIRVTVGAPEQISCTALAVGCKAFVTRQGGLVLRMRSAGRIADNVVARLPIGTELELLEGPAAADGFSWWRVRTLGGNEGWVAGENLVLQPD